MLKFLLEKRQKNDIIHYVISKEEADSDDDYNAFDNQEIDDENKL